MVARRYMSRARVSKHAVAEYADLGRSGRFGGRGRRGGGRGLDPSGILGRNPAAAPVVASAPAELKPPASLRLRRLSPRRRRQALRLRGQGPEPGRAALEPAFDVVNVDPSGEAVIAGRAAPNAKVELRDAGKTVAEATADAAGQFVIIPPALAPGDHSLSLAANDEKGQPEMSKTVAVSVPAPEAKAGVAGRAAGGETAGSGRRATNPNARASALGMRTLATPSSASGSRVAIQSVEADAAGGLVAKGSAEPNAPCASISIRPTSPRPGRNRTAAGL